MTTGTSAAALFPDALPALFFGFFNVFVVLVVVLIIFTVRRERRRREQLQAYAAQTGWYPITSPAPEPVVDAMRSKRSKLAVGTQLGPFNTWLVWHQWTESTGGETTTTSTRNLTRYFVWLGPSFPDVQVRRRTGIGGFLKPVRGIGTGDPAFDKAFLVRPSDDPAPLRLLTPAMRQALLSGQLPVWTISAGVLITGYDDIPRPDNMQPRADVIVYLAQMLTAS